MTVQDHIDAAFHEFGMAQHGDEIQPFAEWVHDVVQPRRVLEIGMNRGGTSRLFCGLASEQVIGVDLPDGPWGGLSRVDAEARNARLTAFFPGFVGILGDSQDEETLDAVDSVVDNHTVIDLLMIDGDHSYLGVKHDFDEYRWFVRNGGWVAFHDILDTQFHRDRGVMVSKLWNELKASGRECKEFIGKDGNWGGIGVVRV